MRVNRIALVIAMCGGLALFAGRAHAGFSTPLADGFWDVNDDANEPNNPNSCFVGTDGFFTLFEAGGEVEGPGTGQQIIIDYDTSQPTNVSRNTKTITVKQNQFSLIRVRGIGGAAFDVTNVVEKCKVSGSVNTSKLTGSVSVSCKGSNLFGILSADQAASVQAAFQGSKRVKFKFNASTGKASLSIKCKGVAFPD